MADRAEAEGVEDSSPRDTGDTDAAEAAEGVDPAVEHEEHSTDTPRSTDAQEGAAGEHESSRMTRLDVRHALEGVDDVMRTITETKGRYSR